MTELSVNPVSGTRQETFERLLAREPFAGLKTILQNLSRSREALCEAAHEATSYENLLAKLGYRVTITKQVHVQDAFSRVGPAGGIKVVLPYYDIPTQGSMPTLVNYDSTITTTPRSIEFFNKVLAAFKRQLAAE